MDERFDLQKYLTEGVEQVVKDAFKAIGAENSAAFNELSSKRIEELLKPLQAKFDAMDQAMKDTRLSSAEQGSAMKTLIEQVMQQSKTVGDEARNLANALTGYSKVQGDFGEMLLIDLLKSFGLE